MSRIKEFFSEMLQMRKNDPVIHCKLFKELGCAHVDGMLCDFPSCSMHIKYKQENG